MRGVALCEKTQRDRRGGPIQNQGGELVWLGVDMQDVDAAPKLTPQPDSDPGARRFALAEMDDSALAGIIMPRSGVRFPLPER